MYQEYIFSNDEEHSIIEVCHILFFHLKFRDFGFFPLFFTSIENSTMNIYVKVTVWIYIFHFVCCHNNLPQTRWLKQQLILLKQFILSEFWAPQKVPVGLTLMRTLLSGCRQLPSHCILTWFLLCVCMERESKIAGISSYKDHPFRLGLHPYGLM